MVVSKYEAGVFRGECLFRYARQAKQIRWFERTKLSPNRDWKPERSVLEEQLPSWLRSTSQRQLPQEGSTTSPGLERIYRRLVLKGTCRWNGSRVPRNAAALLESAAYNP